MLLNFNSNVFSKILVSNFLLLSHRNFIFEKKHIQINGKDKRNSEIVIEHLTIKEHAN
jgi:hypothetical protein